MVNYNIRRITSYENILVNLNELKELHKSKNITLLINYCIKNTKILENIEMKICQSMYTNHLELWYILEKFDPNFYSKIDGGRTLKYVNFESKKYYLMSLYNETSNVINSLEGFEMIK